jgi:hypothetical protein
MLTYRHQRRVAAYQFGRENDRVERQDRRSTFVSYLEAYDAANQKACLVLSDVISSDTELQRGRSSELQEQLTWLAQSPAEMHELRHAYLVLCITAGPNVREAARDCLVAIWKLGRAASRGDYSRFEEVSEEAQEPRDRVRQAMRSELSTAPTP